MSENATSGLSAETLSNDELDAYMDAIFQAGGVTGYGFLTKDTGLREVREAGRKLYERGFADGADSEQVKEGAKP